MTVQDVENVIRGFDDQWREEYEDTTPILAETAQTGPPEKGKDKLDTEAHQTTEVPLHGQKKRDVPKESATTPSTKDGSQETTTTQGRKKQKTSKPTLKTALTEDDYELITTRTCDTLKDSFDEVKQSQEKIQSSVEKQLIDI